MKFSYVLKSLCFAHFIFTLSTSNSFAMLDEDDKPTPKKPVLESIEALRLKAPKDVTVADGKDAKSISYIICDANTVIRNWRKNPLNISLYPKLTTHDGKPNPIILFQPNHTAVFAKRKGDGDVFWFNIEPLKTKTIPVLSLPEGDIKWSPDVVIEMPEFDSESVYGVTKPVRLKFYKGIFKETKFVADDHFFIECMPRSVKPRGIFRFAIYPSDPKHIIVVNGEVNFASQVFNLVLENVSRIRLDYVPEVLPLAQTPMGSNSFALMQLLSGVKGMAKKAPLAKELKRKGKGEAYKEESEEVEEEEEEEEIAPKKPPTKDDGKKEGE